jgi:hypothetical protein
MNNQKINPNGHDPGWVDGGVFNENANRVPWQELAPYENQHVAWTLDGKKIVAGAPTRDELFEKLRQLNIPVSQVVQDYIEFPS